jgi:hypothetical protein
MSQQSGLFYCGNQWGYTPLGNLVNIPSGFCNAPTGLTVTVTNQFALLEWQISHDYVNFVLEYRIVGAPTWTSIQMVGLNRLLTLTQSTEYEWRVKTVCEKDPVRESTWAVGPNFTTGISTPACNAVTTVTITNIGAGYEASWASTGATQYMIVLSGGAGPNQVFYTNQTSYLFTNLEDGIQYQVQVTAICLNGSETAPSPFVIFITSRYCPSPQNLNVIVNGTSLFASWAPPLNWSSSVRYSVYLNGVLIASNYSLTNFTFTLLSEVSSYTVNVITSCGDGFSLPVAATVSTGRAACPATFALSSASITGTGCIINWTTALNGSTLSGIRLIIDNGNPISLAANITTYNITGKLPGSILKVRIYGICSNGSLSNSFLLSVNLLKTNTIVLNAFSYGKKEMTLSWTALPTALFYEVTNGDGSPARITNTNSYRFQSIVVDGRNFTGSVTAYGILNGELVTLATSNTVIENKALQNCYAYNINTRYNTDTSVEVQLSVGNSDILGAIRIAIVAVANPETVIDEVTVTNSGSYILSGLTLGVNYNLYAHAAGETSQSLADDNCIPVINAYTHVECNQITPANFTISQVGSVITVAKTFTATAAQTNIRLWWVLETTQGITTSEKITYTLSNASFVLNTQGADKYKVFAEVSCVNNNVFLPAVQIGVTCPAITQLNISVSGTTMFGLIEPKLLANSKYLVEVENIGGLGRKDAFVDNLFAFTALKPNVLYSVKAKLACTDDPAISGTVSYFITGNEITTTLEGNTFSSYSEESSLFDVDETSNSCQVVAVDWALESYFIIPLGTDPLNSYYFEANFSINVNGLSGEVLLPGGVMGNISLPGCRPASTATMNLELITGANNLVTPGASISTSGNITCSGAFSSNGSNVLAVRVKGSYLKA